MTRVKAAHAQQHRSHAHHALETREPLRTHVKTLLEDYFRDLNGHQPANLYHMVLDEVEGPLLEAVMNYTRGNQTRAAQILGINRSTLRKKLTQHGLQ